MATRTLNVEDDTAEVAIERKGDAIRVAILFDPGVSFMLVISRSDANRLASALTEAACETDDGEYAEEDS